MDLWPGNLDRIICRWLCNPAILNSIFLSLSILNPKSKISTDKVITYCPSSTGCNVILFKFLLWVVKFKIIFKLLQHIGKAALVTSAVWRRIPNNQQMDQKHLHTLKCLCRMLVQDTFCWPAHTASGPPSWKCRFAQESKIGQESKFAQESKIAQDTYSDVALHHLWQAEVGSALRWRKCVTYWLPPHVFRLRWLHLK